MRLRNLGLSFGLLVVVCIFLAFKMSTESFPEIEIPEVIDVGSAVVGSTLQVDIPIKNKSKRQISLEGVTADCRCVVVGEIPDRILPGKTEHIGYSVDTTGMSGEFSRRLIVGYEGGKRIVVNIKGQVFEPFEVTPANWIMLPQTNNRTRIAKVVVGEEFKESFDLSVEAGEWLDVTINEVSRDERVAVFSISFKTLPQGDIHDEIKFILKSGSVTYEQPLQIGGRSAGGSKYVPIYSKEGAFDFDIKNAAFNPIDYDIELVSSGKRVDPEVYAIRSVDESGFSLSVPRVERLLRFGKCGMIIARSRESGIAEYSIPYMSVNANAVN